MKIAHEDPVQLSRVHQTNWARSTRGGKSPAAMSSYYKARSSTPRTRT